MATTADGQIVGHAALVPIDAARGEVCFEVAASWRHHGIAGLLLARLDREAARRQMTTLVAEVLPENADMLAVMHEHGPCREHREAGVIEVLLPVAGARTDRRPEYALRAGFSRAAVRTYPDLRLPRETSGAHILHCYGSSAPSSR